MQVSHEDTLKQHFVLSRLPGLDWLPQCDCSNAPGVTHVRYLLACDAMCTSCNRLHSSPLSMMCMPAHKYACCTTLQKQDCIWCVSLGGQGGQEIHVTQKTQTINHQQQLSQHRSAIEGTVCSWFCMQTT